jgi:hypothetical protein
VFQTVSLLALFYNKDFFSDTRLCWIRLEKRISWQVVGAKYAEFPGWTSYQLLHLGAKLDFYLGIVACKYDGLLNSDLKAQ